MHQVKIQLELVRSRIRFLLHGLLTKDLIRTRLGLIWPDEYEMCEINTKSTPE